MQVYWRDSQALDASSIRVFLGRQVLSDDHTSRGTFACLSLYLTHPSHFDWAPRRSLGCGFRCQMGNEMPAGAPARPPDNHLTFILQFFVFFTPALRSAFSGSPKPCLRRILANQGKIQGFNLDAPPSSLYPMAPPDEEQNCQLSRVGSRSR